MASRDKAYVILTKASRSVGWVRAGSICYIKENLYSLNYQKKDTVPVICIGSSITYNLPLDILQPLSRQKSEFLLAVESCEERLKEFTQSEALDQAMELTVGSEVTVAQNGEWLKGVIRYIGPLSDPGVLDPIAGVFFGVELQGEDKGKGQSDGTYRYKSHFKCQKDCGVFVPFTRIRPLHPKLSAPWAGIPENLTQTLSVGDRVTYILDDKSDCQHGMVLNPMKDGMILISTDTDEHGKAGGEREIPWHCVIKEEDLNTGDWHKCKPERMDISDSPDMVKDPGADVALKVGSVVEVNLAKGPAFATVRWIGSLPDRPSRMAGLELKEACGVSDGTFKDVRYFTCAPKHGLFVKVSSCRPGDRFLGETAVNGHFGHDGQDIPAVPPLRSEDVKTVLTGTMKGIQGHCNSCYMDSALFSLFSCSSVLDSLLFKKTKPNDEPIQKTLLRDIVCPLRSKGFVPEKSVMKLRKQVQERGHCPSYTTDEKDPEEFLTLIMQDILSLEPLLKLKSCNQPKGLTEMEQTSYLYQIFMDYNHSLVLPTVQQLLEHSFYNNGIKLAEVPSCLILTMPRSGKQFKMFPKIIPSLQLDITALLSNGLQQCVLCGQLAHVECSQCFTDSVFSSTGLKVFCDMCSTQVHFHPSRQSHKPTSLRFPEGFPHSCSPGSLAHTVPQEKLELFAVLCIETSHYVSFVKYGPKITDWIFFDSMADRVGETDGFNIPEVKACPEVARYLSMPLAELAKQVPREMDGVAKRLFCDGYMYLYQSPSMALYR
ncbi:ubiquitin carboxyl-terminal hydrolase CYLD isoform X1 [Pangasianodon hypophthalmus]|uniref:ubiquitin carboxyl-terminal hydrolase CYLD isoform X1 n=1 Tax=Pangasianodon hypophthalmus TaxID=310915 RepID=UPI002307258A|nr:ubiquitin carboxyl-terminal hydrolase CYLD isoform X1 [Pangasianodon hypophthalmus]XP_026789183.3 ubiquitin carboxyl-terminal hydrolase CYLD isoform X1 [Pangasianodon hypophthalmus]